MGEKSQKTDTHTHLGNGSGPFEPKRVRAKRKPGPNPEPEQIQPPSQGLWFPSSCTTILLRLPTSEGWFLRLFLYTYFSSVAFNQCPKPDDFVHKALPLCNLCVAAAPVNWINESCTSYFLVKSQYRDCRFARLVSRQLKR